MRRWSLAVALAACALFAAAGSADARKYSGGAIELFNLEAWESTGPPWNSSNSVSATATLCSNETGADVSTSPADFPNVGGSWCDIELYGTLRSGSGWLDAHRQIEFTYTISWTTCSWIAVYQRCGRLVGSGVEPWYGDGLVFTLHGSIVANYTGSWGLWYWTGSLVYAGGRAHRPRNESPPDISGNFEEGQTVIVSRGDWSGDEPQTYAYQWKRCDQDGYICQGIHDAVGESYTLRSADVDHTIQVTVVAANDSGTGVALTPPRGPVTAAS